MWVLMLFAALLDLALCLQNLGSFNAVLYAAASLFLALAAFIRVRLTRTRR